MVHRALALLAATAAGATELTPGNWDEHTTGKQVFIKFLAPWWGHCKKMKPDWDKLMDEFKGSKTSLVADVDCTADGKDLCERHGVQGYPSIKYGDPSNLTDYNGGRDFDALKKFADENLGPVCGPDHIDLCGDEDKAELEKLQKMSPEELTAKIEEAENTVKKLEDKKDKEIKKLTDRLSELQAKVEQETKKKEDAVEKESQKLGVKILRAVASANKKKDEAPRKKKKSKKQKK